mmetsp:Transcript_11100/g.15382  ORF Transcript_11100/g.15382 Transcript_11100/m.15382 type:complete len:340 (-) Transcript_11100:157-1176(-)|eukprot:CAMPEP_0185735946 /NCGR_PEP_ID=MMETSP1171-20130828/26527_1 /TAXON_ID=374046 /ORGANISM="Helicotheca tamensis, Strain CCMP826" /LENGTH=339 /DNA_ID=CAMNT_0028406405 /DNA_START=53 /DNA_END=1072 /DNA_ORIENTATION=+
MRTITSAVTVTLMALCLTRTTDGFAPSGVTRFSGKASTSLSPGERKGLYLSDDPLNQSYDGKYTAKQRLREEVESPFRKVRLLFFGGSTGSALTALYFSLLNVLKAKMGGYTDIPPLDESLESCAINAGAAVICAALAWRDWKAGEANLERIAKGGALAALPVITAESETTQAVKEYRRNSRVILAAGGRNYIETLARSLNSDQLADENVLPQKLQEVDVVIVPVLLDGSAVGDTITTWKETEPNEGDRNFDITRSNSVIAFPRNSVAWYNYLQSEIETASKQGFDVLEKGITITVKKNGRILRRATGQPQWGGIVGTMEVMDGSKFGMPGDDERYGQS